MEVRTGLITGSKVATHPEGSVPGRVLQVAITDIRDVQNAYTSQAGEEFSPTLGCTATVAPGVGDAYKVAIAIDDAMAPVMPAGGKRIYSTDSDGSAVVAEVRLYPDGRVQVFNGEAHITLTPEGAAIVENDAASFTMGADGKFTFHGTGFDFTGGPVTMDSTLSVAGAIESDTSVTAPAVSGTTDVTFAGKSAKGHQHRYVAPSGLANTDPPA